MTFNSKALQRLRRERGLSIRALAKLAGMAPSQVSDLESGQLQNTTVDTLCKLSEALGCKPSDLFTC